MSCFSCRWWWWLVLLVVVLAANHGEYAWRRHHILDAARRDRQVVVQAVSSLQGHSMIGIDERSLAGGGAGTLTFAQLGEWNFVPGQAVPCPSAVSAANGREVSCTGFMYPLQPGQAISTFCLLRTTQTCCFGPRPQFNQYLLVETRRPATFERFRPVTVTGRFVVDPRPDDGYIYRMEATEVAPAAPPAPEIVPEEYARRHGLPLFPWPALAAVGTLPPEQQGVPDAVQALAGQRVVLGGFLLNRCAAPLPQLVVGTAPAAGTPGGARPTLFNAMTVFPQGADNLPPAWAPQGTFTGILHVCDRRVEWAAAGMVSLREAAWCGRPGAVAGQPRLDVGPLLPAEMELVLVGAALLYAWPRIRRHWRTSAAVSGFGNRHDGSAL